MDIEISALADLIHEVPDYPKPGVLFKDITPLLADARALEQAVVAMARPFARSGIELVAGIESRGFIFGMGVARELGAGFVPVRKSGKLPRTTLRREYALEYGSDAVEVHVDAIRPGARVLVVDDVLATGGTLAATCQLMVQAQAVLAGAAVLIELTELAGRSRLPPDLHFHRLLPARGAD